MEQFVRWIVVGGLTVVAGLWVLQTVAVGSPAWAGGGVFAVVGAVAVSYGIWTEIDL